MKHVLESSLALLIALWLCAAPPVRADEGVSDGWITAKAKLALLTDADMDGLTVNVDTYDGKVTLQGKAESDAQKQRAASVVREIDGVKDVRNLIAIVPREQRDIVDVTDENLKRRVNTMLQRDGALQDSKIGVKSVNDGVVVLEGNARSLSDHLRAVEDARAVEGVTRVASEIHSPDKLADDEIWSDDPNNPTVGEGSAWDSWTTAAVKLRLLGNRDIPGLSINVDTHGGVVTLFGAVPTRKVAELAEQEALQASGVLDVENALQVVPEERKDQVAVRDDQISDRLADRMQKSDLDDETDVNFEVKNGVVRVTGSVPSSEERLEVLTLTRSTEGVRSVRDDMTLPKEPESRPRTAPSGPRS